ncbi:isopeptide-forming domain-containing fimbrial protein [Olsenella sp. DNF00959]|uniref:isopeptide-forming domain-containing fimbrial protein n=1 Tax=Olsenella sp. DNF00959 TaxID=1476999 RepID=UPI0007859423|nr:isopeptide-forming domain-containing fimbrial protein [Olsenella sp. DNF00959]KXB61745.1 LPXTG-motif protein cell wall anchor domain protein [Olsenella sp. DNF00959]
MRELRKRLTGVFAVVAAVVMALALVPASAFADATTLHTVTVSEPSGQVDTHSYEAYQVFTGTYDSASKQLQNITWGSGVNGDALLAALKADPVIGSKFADATDAVTAAAAMSGITDKSTDAEALAKVIAANLSTTKFASDNGSIDVVGDGYYFIKDVTESLTSDTYSKYMLQVVGDTAVTAKDTTTTSKKEVKDTNDTTGTTSEWQNTADYDIGDAVPFKLTGTVASDYASYTQPYYFAFHDTYNKSQLGDPQSVVVKIDGTEVDSSAYSVNVTPAGFDVVFSDLKQTAAHAGSTVTVEYTSELLTGANIGSAGNVNSSNIEFSNDSNNDQHHGKTPEDTVIVFTYKVVVNKVNEASQPLAGAGFTLYKKDAQGAYNKVKEIVAGAGTTFEFKGLDDGDYKLEETTVPSGYNKLADVEFSVTSVKDDAGKTLTSINGVATTGQVDLGTQKATVDKDAGSITTTVVNKSGSTLPSTGGMGTTVLYVAGIVLVVAAGVGFAVRRRNNGLEG